MMSTIKFRSVMLALVQNVCAPEALLATEAPRPLTTYHKTQPHLIHSRDRENMTLLRRTDNNPLMHEQSNFLVLRAIQILNQTVIWNMNLQIWTLKMHSFWTIHCMGPFLNPYTRCLLLVDK